MSALVITHTESEGPGHLATWLPEAGLGLEVVEPWRGDALPPSLDGYQALVVMGGPQQAYDDRSAPWLRETKDLIREVAILAERADVTEEIVRLKAHLSQFVEVIHESESAGRKLEFVVQEMGRETNTIGSKANDVEISRSVVEIKGLLEKIRELIQNVE